MCGRWCQASKDTTQKHSSVPAETSRLPLHVQETRSRSTAALRPHPGSSFGQIVIPAKCGTFQHGPCNGVCLFRRVGENTYCHQRQHKIRNAFCRHLANTFLSSSSISLAPTFRCPNLLHQCAGPVFLDDELPFCTTGVGCFAADACGFELDADGVGFGFPTGAA